MRPFSWAIGNFFITGEGEFPMVAMIVRVLMTSPVVVTNCVPVHSETPTLSCSSTPRFFNFSTAYSAKDSGISLRTRSANSKRTTRISDAFILG